MVSSRFPQVGFDPCNRSGVGGNAAEVLLLASDIALVGWSWPATSHAVCVEVPPGDLTVETFNAKLCHDVGLPEVEPHTIIFGSLSCGHTNMGLRALAAQVSSDCPLLSEGGRLSLDKLRKRDPAYAEAVARGLHWKVLKWQVRSRYAKALDIIQARRYSGACFGRRRLRITEGAVKTDQHSSVQYRTAHHGHRRNRAPPHRIPEPGARKSIAQGRMERKRLVQYLAGPDPAEHGAAEQGSGRPRGTGRRQQYSSLSAPASKGSAVQYFSGPDRTGPGRTVQNSTVENSVRDGGSELQ